MYLKQGDTFQRAIDRTERILSVIETLRYQLNFSYQLVPTPNTVSTKAEQHKANWQSLVEMLQKNVKRL